MWGPRTRSSRMDSSEQSSDAVAHAGGLAGEVVVESDVGGGMMTV